MFIIIGTSTYNRNDLYIRHIENNCIVRYSKCQVIQLVYLPKDVQWQNLLQRSMSLELRIPLC